VTEPRWLDETQQQAWRGLLVFVNRGLPRIERTLKEQGLLVVHYSILVALSSAPDDTMRLTELADAANLSQSRLTHRLKTMIERGHIEITADEEDGRGKNATLTRSGRQLLEHVAPIHVEALDADFTGYQYAVDVLDEGGHDVRQRMSTGFHLPFVVRSNTFYESGPRAGHDRVLLLCTSPIDDVTSLFTFVSWRNHDHDLSAAEFLAFDRAIGAEDKAMLERIGGVLPLDQSATVSVRSDRLSVEWRRRLAALLGD
jgi:DNA-binding MarR family transcriptional regulator